MKHILVIGEASDKAQIALDKAIALAKTANVNIHVAINYYEDLHWQDHATAEAQKAQILQIEQSEWQHYITEQCAGVTVTFELLWEKYLVDWVLKQCRTQPYDLIIKQGHRTETLTHTPTDWMLLRESPIPVYIVSPVKNRESNVVLVALDLLAKSGEKQLLNKRLLEEGFRLSVATNSTLHVCYVVKVVAALRDMDLINPAQLLSSATPKAEQALAEISADYDLPQENIHILSGEPNKVICSLANKLRANCVVIGSMGRKGIIGKFFGNTSEQVVTLAHKDLLVISPE